MSPHGGSRPGSGRKTLPPKKKRKDYPVGLSLDERDLILRAAKDAGMTFSGFMRMAALTTAPNMKSEE